jgi:AcrR family transcriptional regulator
MARDGESLGPTGDAGESGGGEGRSGRKATGSSGRAKPTVRARASGRLPAGRHGLTREQVTNSQRKRLIDAMATVCARRTYSGTTISEVVETAGVSRATFYELFRDKEDCFLATMEEWIRLLSGAILPVVYSDGTEGWPGKVRDVLTALLEFIASEPEHATTAMVEALAAGDQAFDRFRVGNQLLISLLDQGRTFGEEPVTAPSGAARAVIGAGESLIVAALINGRSEQVPQLLPDILYLALTPSLGQAQALRYASAARGS